MKNRRKTAAGGSPSADRIDRETMSQILNSIPQSVFWKDTESVYLGCNEVFARACGLERPEDIIGKTDYDLPWPRSEADAYRADDREVMANAEAKRHIIEPLQQADGHRLWIDTSKVPLIDARGNVTGVLGIYDDITETVLVEEALKESEARYRQVIQHTPLGVHMYELKDDDRLVFIGANPAADQILGVDNTQFIGRTIEQAFPPLVQTEVPSRYRQAAREGISWRKEELVYQHGAIHGAYEIYAFQSGKNRVTAVFLDITDRKKAEQSLRESEKKYKDLAELLPETVYECDPSGRIVYANRIALKKFGLTPEILGSGIRLTDLLAPEETERAEKAFGRVLNGEPGGPEEYVARRTDGTTFPVLIHSSHVESQGRTAGMRGILIDLTEMKQLEQDHMELERQMQQTQKLESLGVLAGGIAHDFNNILTSILGNASLGLEELPPSSPGRENLEAIEGSARRAAELCRQMLAYSGKGRFVIGTLHLDDLVEGLKHLLKTSISKKATLILQPEKGTPPIFGDATQIRQIVMNLVINASESLEDQPGYITVSTGTMEHSGARLQNCWHQDSVLRPGRYAWLSVSDTGCGMDAETQRRIFEPFFTTKFTGRGLGLSAVLGIVRGHQGALQLESGRGKGSTFRILFPAAAEEAAGESEPETAREQWKGHGCVLLVDDEEDVRTLGRKMLEHLGFEVTMASNGIEALDIYRRNPGGISLVLLDLTMPYLNGQETFLELHRIDPSVKVFISSGYSESDVASRFSGAELAGFIQKPFTLDELRRKMRENL